MNLANDLFRDSKDGRLSHSKIGVILAGGTFVLKMLALPWLPDMPDDPWLWAVFMGTVGGYAGLLKLIATRAPKE